MGFYRDAGVNVKIEHPSSTQPAMSRLRNNTCQATTLQLCQALEIIDGGRQPDDKEWMIKSRYPDDWKTLQEQCLPFLRRTDYRIDYDITENNINQ